MFIALGVLLGLVSLCPAILIVGGTFLPCLIPLLVATGLILIALNLPPIEAQRFGKLIQPLVICAAIPALLDAGANAAFAAVAHSALGEPLQSGASGLGERRRGVYLEYRRQH